MLNDWLIGLLECTLGSTCSHGFNGSELLSNPEAKCLMKLHFNKVALWIDRSFGLDMHCHPSEDVAIEDISHLRKRRHWWVGLPQKGIPDFTTSISSISHWDEHTLNMFLLCANQTPPTCKCCFPKIIAHNTTTELPRMKFVSCHCISLASWSNNAQCSLQCSPNSWLSSGTVSAHRVFGWTQRTPKKHFRVSAVSGSSPIPMQWEKPGISAAIASSHLRPCRRHWYGVMGCHGNIMKWVWVKTLVPSEPQNSW